MRLLARAGGTADSAGGAETGYGQAGGLSDSGIVVGPGIGLDGAVLDVRVPESGSPPFLVAASDPITFAAEEIGWYAVHVNANDVACMGALPRWFVVTVLLPDGTEEGDVTAIFDQIRQGCDQVGATLVGGHTEIAPDIGRPILMGTMLGVTTRWISGAGARPGDDLLLTKGIAIEGTAILAREKAGGLEGKVAENVLNRARDFLHDPGISVVPEARLAMEAGTVHAFHDPTEGGLAGGIRELCQASGTGARIDLDSIHVFDETRALAALFDIDPLGLIASGALLIAAPSDEAGPILGALDEAGIDATRIGTIVEDDAGVTGVRKGEERPLSRFPADELGKAL